MTAEEILKKHLGKATNVNSVYWKRKLYAMEEYAGLVLAKNVDAMTQQSTSQIKHLLSENKQLIEENERLKEKADRYDKLSNLDKLRTVISKNPSKWLVKALSRHNDELKSELAEKEKMIEGLEAKIERIKLVGEKMGALCSEYKNKSERYSIEIDSLQSTISELRELPVYLSLNGWTYSHILNKWHTANQEQKTTEELLNSIEFKQYLNK